MADAGVLLVLVPVVVAGIVQILVIRFDPLPWSAVPLDLGRSWHGARVLGDHKTVRGFLVMPVACGLASAAVMPALLPASAPAVGWWWFGVALGLGYVVAELPNSFVKRRLRIGSGDVGGHPRLQLLADQGDSVIGVVVAVVLLAEVSWPWLLLAALLGLVVHLATDRLLWVTGVKHDDAPRIGASAGGIP